METLGLPAAGRLVILSGPSGVGKDTVLDAWRAVNPTVKRVVSYTTRPPRVGELDGVDYHFISIDRYEKLLEEGAFLEAKQVHGNFYATPLNDMLDMLEAGLIAVLKIDVQGAMVAMEKITEALSIFILPPSFEVLEQRIRGRGTDAPKVIEKRLENARLEMELADHYRHQIVNDEIPAVVNKLQQILQISTGTAASH